MKLISSITKKIQFNAFKVTQHVPSLKLSNFIRWTLYSFVIITDFVRRKFNFFSKKFKILYILQLNATNNAMYLTLFLTHFGLNIISNVLYLAMRNNIGQKTTELVLIFHKYITKLVFLWLNMAQKKHQSVKY